MKKTRTKKAPFVDKVEATTETLTNRAGINLFVRYLRESHINQLFDRYFSFIRKSKKELSITDLFIQVLCRNMSMKVRNTISIFLVALVMHLLSAQSFAEDVESKVVNGHFGESISSASGKDGRLVVYPTGWKTAEGKDGRIVAYPFGWTSSEGTDGRIVAYPFGWTSSEGTDGRNVARPFDWTSSEGTDGRNVAYPFGWTSSEGTDERIVAYPFGWTFSEGTDGRNVAYPFGWTFSEGTDGRNVAYPFGWTSSEGTDGRNVARPFGWTSSEGTDGRNVAYPFGWTTKQGADGRIVAVPSKAQAPLLLHDAATVAMVLEVLKEKPADANNLAVYFWANQDE